jgi:DNA-3-methyladenine glycosylase
MMDAAPKKPNPTPGLSVTGPGRSDRVTGSRRLSRRFYTRNDVILVARELLGKLLVVPAPDGTRVSGLIVETEAYMGPADKASHAYGHRRTARNETMFGPGGAVYVFFVYGMHYQFNVVSGRESVPHAVLVRALEPVEGIELMRQRRATTNDRNLASGPGKLCKALGIDRSHNGCDLLGDKIWIERTRRRISDEEIASGVRIGIDYAEEYAKEPWRFWIKGNANVSR